MMGRSWVVTAGSAAEAATAVHAMHAVRTSANVGRNAHAGRMGPATAGGGRMGPTAGAAGAVAGPFTQAQLQAMLPGIHQYLKATAQKPWHQTRIGGVQAGQFDDSGWSTLQLVLAAMLGFGAGLFGGWVLANMMQIGTALAPAAATALKAAPLAAL
jgi:hypothetical protein